MPSIQEAATLNVADLEKLLKLRRSDEMRDFRRWLRTIDAESDDELRSRVEPIKDRLKGAIEGPVARTIRWAAVTGVGLAGTVVGVRGSPLRPTNRSDQRSF